MGLEIVHIIDSIIYFTTDSLFPAKERHAKWTIRQNGDTHTVEDVEKRHTDGGRETEGKGVSVERIYEWGLSVGYGPGSSVVHSSVIFTTPQAPMCLPVAAMYTHAHTHSLTRIRILNGCARIDCSLQRNPVTIQLPYCYVIGKLTSALLLSSHFPPLSVFSAQSAHYPDCPPDHTCRHETTIRKSEHLTVSEYNLNLNNNNYFSTSQDSLATLVQQIREEKNYTRFSQRLLCL